MQQTVTNLENEVDELINSYRQADGYLKSLMKASIVDRYLELRSYHRNIDNVFMPKYQRITEYVVNNDMLPNWFEDEH